MSGYTPWRQCGRDQADLGRTALLPACGRLHHDTDWTIARLSREVGLDERRPKEGFRHTIGKPVHAYLQTTSLNAAAALLFAGATVTEAAHAVGFDNLSHSSKAFREDKGVLPSHHKAG